MNCDHRETEGYEFKLFEVGPKCHGTAAYVYEWGGDEVCVCERHARELREDGPSVELREVYPQPCCKGGEFWYVPNVYAHEPWVSLCERHAAMAKLDGEHVSHDGESLDEAWAEQVLGGVDAAAE